MNLKPLYYTPKKNPRKSDIQKSYEQLSVYQDLLNEFNNYLIEDEIIKNVYFL